MGPPMGRLPRWLVLGAFGAVAAPACGDAFGVGSVIGIWNTVSIGGHSLPGAVVYEGDSYDTEYVRWVLYDGGLCTLTQRVDGVMATYDDCDYSVNVEQKTLLIVFLSEVWNGSVEESSMTLTDPQDVVWVLRQQ